MFTCASLARSLPHGEPVHRPTLLWTFLPSHCFNYNSALCTLFLALGPVNRCPGGSFLIDRQRHPL